MNYSQLCFSLIPRKWDGQEFLPAKLIEKTLIQVNSNLSNNIRKQQSQLHRPVYLEGLAGMVKNILQKTSELVIEKWLNI